MNGKNRANASGARLVLTARGESPMIRSRGLARLESYMQFPVPQITALLLLVHLGFGCCWHHPHTWTAVRCDAVSCDGVDRCHATVANTGHGSSEANHHDDPHQRHEGGEQHPQHCEGTSCVFARLDHVPEWDDAVWTAVSSWVRTAWNPQDDVISSHVCRTLDHGMCDKPVPLRAHLVYQVLLI